MEEYRNYMYFVKVQDTGIEGCYFEPEYFDEAAEAIKFAMELADDDPETRVIVVRVGFDGFDDLGNPEIQSQEDEVIWDSFEDDYEEDAEEEAEEANEVDYEEAERDARAEFDQGGWDETKPSQAYLEGEGCEEGCTNEACEKKLDECGPVEEACEENLEECGATDVDESVNKAEATKLTTFDGKRPERLDVNSPKSELNEDGEEFLDYYLDIPDGDEEEAALNVLKADVDPFDVDWTDVKPTEK